LAKFSMALDDRWRVGYSDQAGVVSGRSCEACGRRASIHLVGGRSGDCGPEQVADTGDGGVLEDRAVHLCGWCHIEGPILTEKDLERELIAAARDAVAWRWRSEPGRG
jgi:hypothetical protein